MFAFFAVKNDEKIDDSLSERDGHRNYTGFLGFLAYWVCNKHQAEPRG